MKKYLFVFLLSMIPVLELRFSIPFAAANGLPFGWTYALAVIGNMLPVPLILLFIPALFAFMRRHHILVGLVDWLERKAQKGAKKIGKRSENAAEETTAVAPAEGNATETVADDASTEGSKTVGTLAFLGLYLFVAIPLPGTGAWTGSLAAALFGMKKRRAFFAVFLGVLTAGVIMTLASYGIVSAFRFFAK